MDDEAYFHDLAVAEAEELLQPDEYYEKIATPLKSAKALKEAHRDEIVEFLELKGVRKDLIRAEEIIRAQLPGLISAEEFEKVKKELDGAPDHFWKVCTTIRERGIEKEGEEEKPIYHQELFGFSDDTLMHFYSLTTDLVRKKEYEKACSLCVFLELMAPYVAGYWCVHGLCLQALLKDQEALLL